jgi:transposase InsO family protein
MEVVVTGSSKDVRGDGEEPQGHQEEKAAPHIGGEAEGAGGAGGDPDQDDELVVIEDEPEVTPPKLGGSRRGSGPRPRVTRAPQAQGEKPRSLTGEQRLLILDSWQRSKLPAGDFAPLVGVSSAALYKWKRLFETEGPASLEEGRRGPAPGSKVSEPTRRVILLLKQAKPDWGQDRIHYELQRTKGLQASPGAIAKVLAEEGYQVVEQGTKRHPPTIRNFERARPNQLWQTDLFTFVLKRQSRRVHLVAFMDDHSRFVVGYGLHATASGALVREVFESGITNYGPPDEVLTDNGSQYVTWRGKSAFARLCERRGIRHIVASPRRPQTLGKCERFWGTLWRECLETAIFVDLEDARLRIGHFVDHYNFYRTHQGIDGLVPADRFFRAAPEVKSTLLARVAKNALELARDGVPRKPFYLTGRVGDVGIALHAEGQEVVLTREDGTRERVDLGATGRRAAEEIEQTLPRPVAAQVVVTSATPDDEDDLPPGASPLDGALEALDDQDDDGVACAGDEEGQ